jgi:probable addiction module antidote protein
MMIMARTIRVSELPEFDMAEQLKSAEDVAMYLNLVLEEDDPAELAYALGVIARSRGMPFVADATGITREALYKALRPGAQPRFDTISKVIRSFGVRLVAEPLHS